MSNARGRLRDYFEDELLVQVGRRLELTPRAEVLREAVRDVLVRIDTSIAAQPQFDCTNSDREFRLCISDYSMEVLLPRVLANASRLRSTVRFRLQPQVAYPARALERGEADLLVIPKACVSPDHPTDMLFNDEFVCAVWRESSHARRGLGFEDYASAGHVVMQPVDTDKPAFESWFVQRFGLSPRSPSCITNKQSFNPCRQRSRAPPRGSEGSPTGGRRIDRATTTRSCLLTIRPHRQ